MKYLLDSHTHTIASGHAYNTVNEMVQAAADKGLSLFAITEHAMAMPGTCHEYYFSNLRVMRRQRGSLEVLFGTEANIVGYDGALDMDHELLEQMDVVIASLHVPCLRPGTKEQNTEAVLGAMRNPYVTVIGHPDDGRFPLDYEAVVAEAKERKVLLEVNNSSLNPRGFRKHTADNVRTKLELCRRYEAPVILNSDAHCAEDIANFCFCEEVIREIDFPKELIVNRSVEEYKKYIAAHSRFSSPLRDARNS